MNMAISKWVGLAAIIWTPAVQAANYELVDPFPMTCEGILVSENGIYGLVEDAGHLNSNSDDDILCLHATIAEKSSTPYALQYTLKDKEISRILKTCSVGKLCRIEGLVSGLSHDVWFFVKIDSVSAK